MERQIKLDCIGVDWTVVSDTLKSVGMARFKKDISMKERGFTE